MDSKEINRKFRRLFAEFNSRYFKDKLPRYRVQVVDYVSKRNPNVRGKIHRRQRIIRLKASEEHSMIEILLHEMAHAANRTDGHGKKFFQIVENLKVAGAPISGWELPDPEFEMPKRLTKRLIRNSINDALLDSGGKVNLWKFLRWFVVSYEWASSPTGLLRRYPWIRELFNQEKQHFLRAKELREMTQAKFRP